MMKYLIFGLSLMYQPLIAMEQQPAIVPPLYCLAIQKLFAAYNKESDLAKRLTIHHQHQEAIAKREKNFILNKCLVGKKKAPTSVFVLSLYEQIQFHSNPAIIIEKIQAALDEAFHAGEEKGAYDYAIKER